MCICMLYCCLWSHPSLVLSVTYALSLVNVHLYATVVCGPNPPSCCLSRTLFPCTAIPLSVSSLTPLALCHVYLPSLGESVNTRLDYWTTGLLDWTLTSKSIGSQTARVWEIVTNCLLSTASYGAAQPGLTIYPTTEQLFSAAFAWRAALYVRYARNNIRGAQRAYSYMTRQSKEMGVTPDSV